MYPITDDLIRIMYEERVKEALSLRQEWMHGATLVTRTRRRPGPLRRLRRAAATALRQLATSIEPDTRARQAETVQPG